MAMELIEFLVVEKGWARPSAEGFVSYYGARLTDAGVGARGIERAMRYAKEHWDEFYDYTHWGMYE